MGSPRRLTIVVEILPDDPGASDTASDAAQGVLDGTQPHQLLDAQWSDPPPGPLTATLNTGLPGRRGCVHCVAEGRPCWVHAQ